MSIKPNIGINTGSQPFSTWKGPAWHILVGFKTLRYFNCSSNGSLFFTFCNWSYKIDLNYYLSFMNTRFLLKEKWGFLLVSIFIWQKRPLCHSLAIRLRKEFNRVWLKMGKICIFWAEANVLLLCMSHFEQISGRIVSMSKSALSK